VGKTRILLAVMPRMLADIVRNVIASQIDFELAGELLDTAGLAQAVSSKTADVLIVGGSVGSDAVRRLLYQQPRLRIVTIETGGRQGAVLELRPHVGPLGELSCATLVAAIRGIPEAIGREARS
jgi:hypothetical protein